jgi:citrate synthase
VWPDTEHPAGFDPHGASCATPVLQTLHHLASNPCARALAWLRAHREDLESAAGCPLAMTGVAAAAFRDLEFSNDQSEMLFLLLRLPGAAAHALEQRESGYRHFPFFGAAVRIENDPGPYQANGEVNHQLNESVA